LRAQMEKERVPGLTIGYVQGGTFWAKGFGLADVENGVPAGDVSAYRYASVQKSMTATAILQLAERGRIDLGAEVQAYVPYYPKKRYPVVVRDLLGHLAGIPHYVNRAVEQHFTDRKTTRQAVEVFAGYDLVNEPGTAFSYSSYGYNLLGAAIEGASGQSYADYMRDHVWRPAGMAATRMDDPLALIPHRVRGYQEVDGQLRNSEFVDVSSRFAAGGTRGTVPDLLRFMKALNEGALLSPRSLELMYTPMKTRRGGFSGFPRTLGYAMGWNVMTQKGRRVLHNDGGQQETRTMMINVPELRFAAASAQNLEKDGDGLPPVLSLYGAVLGEKFEL
jgi:CubicO group peptidase (beta-lactamase class C family)